MPPQRHRLYWIDEEFTVLTRNAAPVLPPLGFVPGGLPAAHGFVAWTQPVDVRRRCMAASWTSHGDVVQLTHADTDDHSGDLVRLPVIPQEVDTDA